MGEKNLTFAGEALGGGHGTLGRPDKRTYKPEAGTSNGCRARTRNNNNNRMRMTQEQRAVEKQNGTHSEGEKMLLFPFLVCVCVVARLGACEPPDTVCISCL